MYIQIKNVVLVMLFGFFINQDLLAMNIVVTDGSDPDNGLVAMSPTGSPDGMRRYSSLGEIKSPSTGLSKQDMKDLESALSKMLNFSSWLELHYSIQAVVEPYKGSSDKRIQKYVEKWAIPLELAPKVTETIVGNILKSLCEAKKINLNQPDSSGFLPLTLAVYDNNVCGTRVLLAAGVDPKKTDRHGYTPLRLAQRFRYTLIEGALGQG